MAGYRAGGRMSTGIHNIVRRHAGEVASAESLTGLQVPGGGSSRRLNDPQHPIHPNEAHTYTTGQAVIWEKCTVMKAIRPLNPIPHPRQWLAVLVLFTLTSAAFVALNTASALTLDSVRGSWANAGPGQPSCLSIANGDDASFVSYGLPLDETCPDGVELARQSGFGFQPSQGVNFAPGAVFALGEFTHYNRYIYNEQPLNQVDLVIDLSFSSPAGLTTELVYTVNLEETLNIAGTCAYGGSGDIACPDRVSFASTFSDQTFVYNDVEYTLQLVGFAPKTGATCSYGSAINEFITQEDQANTACLFGRVVANDASIEIGQTLAQSQPLRPGTDADFSISVSNTGTLSFDRVEVAGTACDMPPVYQSGDANSDGLLDPDETWIYSCRASQVGETFTNTAMVGVSRLGTTRIDRLVDLPVEVARLSSLTIAKATDLGWGPPFQFAVRSSPERIVSLNVGEQFTLADLMPGTYQIVEQPVDGWVLDDIVCNGAQQSAITPIENGVAIQMAQGEAITCVFEGAAEPGAIRVISYEDPTGDSPYQSQPRLQGWTYTLFDGETVVGSLATSGDGVAQWEGLLPGTYTVCQDTPAGWVNTRPGGDACMTATFAEPDFASVFLFGNRRLDPVCEISLNGIPLGGDWSRPWQGDNDTLAVNLRNLRQPVTYYWEMARASDVSDEAPVASGSGEFASDGSYSVPVNYPAEGQWGRPGADGRYTLQVTFWIDAPCGDVGWQRWYDAPDEADLALTGGGPAEADPEAEVTYGFQVVNNGPRGATGLNLRINLPQGLRLLAAPENCNGEGRGITCRWESLAAQQGVGVEIRALVVNDGELAVTAAVDAAQPADPDASNNRAEIVTVVEALPPDDDDDDDDDDELPPLCTEADLLAAFELGIIQPPGEGQGSIPSRIIEIPGRVICLTPVINPLPEDELEALQELFAREAIAE